MIGGERDHAGRRRAAARRSAPATIAGPESRRDRFEQDIGLGADRRQLFGD